MVVAFMGLLDARPVYPPATTANDPGVGQKSRTVKASRHSCPTFSRVDAATKNRGLTCGFTEGFWGEAPDNRWSGPLGRERAAPAFRGGPLSKCLSVR